MREIHSAERVIRTDFYFPDDAQFPAIGDLSIAWDINPAQPRGPPADSIGCSSHFES
jgi:hypothetical protein